MRTKPLKGTSMLLEDAAYMKLIFSGVLGHFVQQMTSAATSEVASVPAITRRYANLVVVIYSISVVAVIELGFT